jgi:hypothetical protein
MIMRSRTCAIDYRGMCSVSFYSNVKCVWDREEYMRRCNTRDQEHRNRNELEDAEHVTSDCGETAGFRMNLKCKK